ncbi:DNA-processing protein DprA [Azonexus sp.]|uniref:DNA-processing protein DprA n=1 Tax=Azonexus sp. TaxID=1872668 RepID=UPI0035B26BAB
MIDPQGLAAWLRLTLVPGIGGETQRKLLAAFGLPTAIFAASPSSLRSVIGNKADLLLDFPLSDAVERHLDWAGQANQHILTLADAGYPRQLLNIADPPTLLFVRGDPSLLQRPALGIVGSRNATPQGLRNATQFAARLAENALCIVSGLALGIDTAAHRGALSAGGSTIAVIGTGADRVYPARNHELALAIAEKGAIVSEFPLGTPPLAANFPRRNRIIAGLSLGVLVVEAAVESGSLITARLAGEQGREVFAIPGSIHAPQSRGCHRLIRDGAKLVEAAGDILEELATSSGTNAASPPDEAEPALLILIGHDPCSFDELVERSGMPANTLQGELLTLELAGRIGVLPGNRWQRID